MPRDTNVTTTANGRQPDETLREFQARMAKLYPGPDRDEEYDPDRAIIVRQRQADHDCLE